MHELQMSPLLLDKILRAKREELERQKKTENFDTLKRRAEDASPVRDFRSAIHVKEQISLIAEIKRSSPSRGKITGVDVTDLARQYNESQAAAISVLTDSNFQGNIEHLTAVRGVTSKPILRKDFILDAYQVHQSRANGADAVLLIASLLEKDVLLELFSACREAGLHVLVESHTEEDLAKIPTEAQIYGINNRDLNSPNLTIDMETTLRLLPLVPERTTIVCESGIFE